MIGGTSVSENVHRSSREMSSVVRGWTCPVYCTVVGSVCVCVAVCKIKLCVCPVCALKHPPSASRLPVDDTEHGHTSRQLFFIGLVRTCEIVSRLCGLCARAPESCRQPEAEQTQSLHP